MPEVTICSHYPGDWRCGECYLCQLRKTQNVLQRELERAERAERERDELREALETLLDDVEKEGSHEIPSGTLNEARRVLGGE